MGSVELGPQGGVVVSCWFIVCLRSIVLLDELMSLSFLLKKFIRVGRLVIASSLSPSRVVSDRESPKSATLAREVSLSYRQFWDLRSLAPRIRVSSLASCGSA